MKNIIIVYITFWAIKLAIKRLLITKRENNIDKVQIKKFKNSLMKPLFNPISEVVKSRLSIIKSTKIKFENSSLIF